MKLINKATKNGSILLEAAIFAPIVLLLIFAMASSITVVNADLYMQRATENVVAELNVAIPLASNGFMCLDDLTGALDIGNPSETDTGSIDQILGVIGYGSGAVGIDLEDVAATALLGRIIRDRIANEYEKLIGNGWVYGSLVSNLSVYIDYENEDHSIYLDIFYDIGGGDWLFTKKYTTSLAIYADPIIFGSNVDDDHDVSDGVWEKDNFERGAIFREKYGGDLPYNYPVICAFDNGEAISVKSIDTTSPLYQNEKSMDKQIKSYIRDLDEFEGANYGEYSISNEEIKKKTLVLVIPENGSDFCNNRILELTEYANSYDIRVEIEKYGISKRYESYINEDD